MKTSQRIWAVRVGIVISLVIVCVVDLWILKTWGSIYTISNIVTDWSQQWPMLIPVTTFTFGILTGHFFWQNNQVKLPWDKL